MTWATLLLLAGAGYALKAVGPVLVGRRDLPATTAQVLGLLAAPVLAGLVAVQTFGDGERLVLDARVPAVAVAAILVYRRAPFLVVILAAAATAALLRALG